MPLAVILACAFVPPQLEVAPYPARAGEPVTVRASRDGVPLPAIPIAVELPAGRVASCGVSDAAGEVPFAPAAAGYHVFVAPIDGVRVLTPLGVAAGRPRWPLALGSVPLGLALLWWHLRPRSGAAARAPA